MHLHRLTPTASDAPEPGRRLRMRLQRRSVQDAPLPDLSVGQVIDPNTIQFVVRDGDINQEDITNNAVSAWQAMPCFHFSLTDNPGIDHFSLPGNADLLARLIKEAALPRSDCRS